MRRIQRISEGRGHSSFRCETYHRRKDTIMQITATRQDSKQATDTDVPRETTRASTTFAFTRRRFCNVAAATISAGLVDIHGFCRRDEAMTDGMAGIAQRPRTVRTLRFFMTIFRNRSIWTSIRLIGSCIGPTAGNRASGV